MDDLYRRQAPAVLRRARTLLGYQEAARDVLQELFASLVERPRQLRGCRSVTSWLYVATTNLCLNKIRNQKNRQRLLELQLPSEQDGQPAKDETTDSLRKLLQNMPSEAAKAAVYYYVDELTHAEVAKLMGCSRRKVGMLIEKAQAWAQKQEGLNC